MVHINISCFTKDYYRDQLLEKKTDMNKFYRFRVTEKDHKKIFTNSKIIKAEYGIKFPDLMRYFARHCTDSDVMYALGLLEYDKEILDIKLQF